MAGKPIELRVARPTPELVELRDRLIAGGNDAIIICEFAAVSPQEVYEYLRVVLPWSSVEDETTRVVVDAVLAYAALRWREHRKRTKAVVESRDGHALAETTEPDEQGKPPDEKAEGAAVESPTDGG